MLIVLAHTASRKLMFRSIKADDEALETNVGACC